jgi:Phytanoyl-CoA dioxygenase (PhyH)
MIPVQRDSVRLFHPKHDQAWDLRRPNVAGTHNHELFVNSLNHGYAEKTMITETQDRTDTAVVIAVFGSDPTRLEANIEGIRGQLQQDLYADVFLVELLVDDAKSQYPEEMLSSVHHLPVRTTEACLDLFQKEALLNYGWRAAFRRHAYDYFIFADADVYSTDNSWFRRIRSQLQRNPARAVQGWRTVRDTLDPTLHYSSVGAAFVLNHPTDLPLNPGICWGLHRALLEMGDGFNPYCLDCGGDSAFVVEYLNTSHMQYDPWLYQWGWFREVERELPFHAQLDCVTVDLVHVHHGYLKERNYDGFRYAMDALRPLSELIHTNGDGLLEWKDPECVERKILCQRQAMGSRAEVDELLRQFSYSRYVRPKLPKNGFPAKSLFQIPGSASSRVPDDTIVHNAARQGGLKIFDPEQVFRKDFPFSWCDGVFKAENSTYIPIVDTEDAAILFLDGKPDASYIVCALPLQPTWLPVDVTPYGALQFSIRVPALGPSDIYVNLVSQSEEGVEHNSCELSLHEQGLQPGEWTDLSLPLDQFTGDGFDRKSVRLVKFVSHQSCRLELSKIYLTEENSRKSLQTKPGIETIPVSERLSSVFSNAEIEQFITDGFVMLRGGFSREFIWKHIGLWEDCRTFEQPMVHVQKHFTEEPFNRVMNSRLKTALDELMGTDRFIMNQAFGWWPVLLPGFPGRDNWHVDGENFRHRLTSPEQGLVAVFLFSDIGPGDGGTPLVRGSHRMVARLLEQAEPAGLDCDELNKMLPPVDTGKIVEVTGEAGDVAMLHPFLIHGFSPNHGNRIRFACNPQYQLKEPMKLDRRDGLYSPVERAICRALCLSDRAVLESRS